MNRYQVLGREWSSDYWQQRGEFTSKQVAIRFAREWLDGRYLGQSEVVVYKRPAEGWHFPEEIARYKLGTDGRIEKVGVYQ